MHQISRKFDFLFRYEILKKRFLQNIERDLFIIDFFEEFLRIFIIYLRKIFIMLLKNIIELFLNYEFLSYL